MTKSVFIVGTDISLVVPKKGFSYTLFSIQKYLSGRFATTKTKLFYFIFFLLSLCVKKQSTSATTWCSFVIYLHTERYNCRKSTIFFFRFLLFIRSYSVFCAPLSFFYLLPFSSFVAAVRTSALFSKRFM